MDNQQHTDLFWDIDCSGMELTQDEIDEMTQEASEFAFTNSHDLQPMDTVDYSYLADSYRAPPQSNTSAELPNNGGGPSYLQMAEDFLATNFTDFLNGDSLSADQATKNMAEGLDDIINTGPTYQQSTITDELIDPALLGEVPGGDFLPTYPTETFEDHTLPRQSPQTSAYNQPGIETLQQDFEYDDSGLFGDGEPVSAAAVSKSQLFLPAPSRSAAKRPNQKPVTKEIPSSPQGKRKRTAAPKTPTRSTFRPSANVSPLTCAGEIEVLNTYTTPDGVLQNKPHKYTIYKPLGPWGKIDHNNRGYLQENINFTSATMTEFVEQHPLGNKLILRIEKHPYEMKGRDTGKVQYARCRAKKCLRSPQGRILVGELRVAIDEVTGRFSPGQIQNNCPYFAAGFIHLECFESLMNPAPLISAGILIPDSRVMLPHEPERIRRQGGPGNNKMGLARKQINQFERWKKDHPAGSERAEGVDSLNAVMWMSGQREGRVKSRYPRGITAKMVAKFLKENRTANGWGGRRMTNGTVDDLKATIAAGKADEIIAPRNGPTGKKGMKIAGKRQKRCRYEADSSSEESDPEPDSPPPQQKKRRANPKNDTDDNATTRRESHRRRSRVDNTKLSSPISGMTFFDNSSVVPQKGNDASGDEPLREITREEAMATRRHTSPNEGTENYIISSDNENDKENRFPSWSRQASLD